MAHTITKTAVKTIMKIAYYPNSQPIYFLTRQIKNLCSLEAEHQPIMPIKNMTMPKAIL